MHKNTIAILLTISFIIQASPAYAYLDPGTGSLILQGLIGGIAATGAIISLYFHKIKCFFKSKSSRSDTATVKSKDDR